MSQNGKGSRQRPKGVDYKTWSKNYDRIFGVKHKSKPKTKPKNAP